MKIFSLIFIALTLGGISCDKPFERKSDQLGKDTSGFKEPVTENSFTPSDSTPTFDTTTISGKAEKLLWHLRDSGYYPTVTSYRDTLIDANGDRQSDLLVEYYGCCGTGIKNRAEIFLFDKSANRFLTDSPIILSNPTFNFTNNTLVGYYVGAGGGHAYKLKWRGMELDTLEYIEIDLIRKAGEITGVKSSLHNYRTGKISETVSDMVSLPREYKYGDYKPIVRKDN